MAAYHWEARRRQMQMERRLQLKQEREASGAGRWQDVLGEGKAKDLPPSYSALPLKPGQKDAAGCSCTCNTAHVPQHSGKLLNRYSTTEYVQQW